MKYAAQILLLFSAFMAGMSFIVERDVKQKSYLLAGFTIAVLLALLVQKYW